MGTFVCVSKPFNTLSSQILPIIDLAYEKPAYALFKFHMIVAKFIIERLALNADDRRHLQNLTYSKKHTNQMKAVEKTLMLDCFVDVRCYFFKFTGLVDYAREILKPFKSQFLIIWIPFSWEMLTK